MRVASEVLIENYQRALFAAAWNICRNVEDAEDAVQDTFLEYHLGNKQFESEQHIRAWLLRVVINKSKNIVHSFWHRKQTTWEDDGGEAVHEDPDFRELMEAVMSLPEKYRIVIHLYYYEDCSTKEMSGILQISESNVRKRLSRGRVLLREKLQEEWEDDE